MHQNGGSTALVLHGMGTFRGPFQSLLVISHDEVCATLAGGERNARPQAPGGNDCMGDMLKARDLPWDGRNTRSERGHSCIWSGPDLH